MSRRSRGLPRPLLLLLIVTTAVGATWALIVPAGQAPDESAHFGYAQTLAERFDLPDTEPGETFSTEQQLAEEYSNVTQTAGSPLTKPEWSSVGEREFDARQSRLNDGDRADGGHQSPDSGSNPARTNPPLYYLSEALPYLAASGGDLFDRWFLMRLWSVLLLVVATAATWLLIGEVIGPRRSLQLVGAGTVGLFPMATFTSSSVSPDGALIATWALAFWLGARLVRRGPSVGSVAALSLVTAAAVLTKATGYALVPAVAVVVLGSLWSASARSPGREWARPAAIWAGVAFLAFAVPVGAWLVLARVLDRRAVNEVPSAAGGSVVDVSLFDYLWQFYLPKLSFQAAIPPIQKLPVYDVWVKTGWGAFGWLEVRFPNWVYVALTAISALVIVGGIVSIALRRRPGDIVLAAFFVVAVAALLAGLHWVEWRSIVNQGTVFNQGRYLLPVLPLFGLLAAACIRLLPGRAGAAAGGAMLGGLLVLQAFALAIVSFRFYA